MARVSLHAFSSIPEVIPNRRIERVSRLLGCNVVLRTGPPLFVQRFRVDRADGRIQDARVGRDDVHVPRVRTVFVIILDTGQTW